MCGIVGFVGDPNHEALDAMVRSLRHRGPDGRGIWSDGRRIHLGHTRLGIIDMEGGAQPMASADGLLVIVYNGEIYEHAAMRRHLEAKGHVFRTRSDTEVILASYTEWGEKCVDHLHGMFAFVILDAKRNVLFGARDRFGKKPLYYTEQPMGQPGGQVEFAFASELTSLIRHPTVSRETSLSVDGVISYLLNDATGENGTIRSNIRQLPPAHVFMVDLSSRRPVPTTSRYWQIEIGGDATSPQEIDGVMLVAGKLLELLDCAVERRLVGDVPLGLLLSGGVDSSAILSMMARHRDPKEIATFSIGFDDPSFDETPHAEEVAAHFGTCHHHRLFSAREMLDELPGVVGHLDEPMSDPSILPTAMLSKLARERVTVALSGEGGDEIFAGYDPFRALKAARWLRRLTPAFVRSGLLRPLARMLPKSEANMSLNFKVDRFLRGLDVPASIQLPTWLGSFSLSQLQRLLPDYQHRFTPEKQFDKAMERYAQYQDDVNRALDYFQRFYLPNDILRKVDRASMMHSLEVRCPLLDTELVESMNRLPAEWKFRGGATKWILKQALMRGDGQGPLLPRKIIHRRKKGFGIPIARWLRTDLRNHVEEFVVEEWPKSLAYVARVERRRLVDEHFNRRRNHAKEIWSLLVLSMWMRLQSA